MEYNLFDPQTIEQILSKSGLKPAKRFGQNFILSPEAVEAMILGSQVNSKDTIYEIGPGLGTLTSALISAAGQVVAIEKDKRMIEVISNTLGQPKNLTLINQDALDFKWSQIPGQYKIVANLPYYITAPFIRSVLESSHQPQIMTLMVQKEVAQRICSKPPHMSILSLAVQYYARAEIIFEVNREFFYPSPKVDSAIIVITPQKTNETPEEQSKFFRLVKIGFSSPRKKLVNNLSNGLGLTKGEIEAKLKQVNIDILSRPENLDINQWKMLIKSFEL